MRFLQSGFSLIELTVVLVLVSLIGGLVLPGLAGAYQSISLRDDQEKILLRLESLGYQAFSDGVAIRIETQDHVEQYLEPPQDWTIEIIEPVEVTAKGICASGELILISQTFSRSIRIQPPFCSEHR